MSTLLSSRGRCYHMVYHYATHYSSRQRSCYLPGKRLYYGAVGSPGDIGDLEQFCPLRRRWYRDGQRNYHSDQNPTFDCPYVSGHSRRLRTKHEGYAMYRTGPFHKVPADLHDNHRSGHVARSGHPAEFPGNTDCRYFWLLLCDRLFPDGRTDQFV